MSSDIFDVVRKHLLETNAMEEAEELLLRQILDGPSQSHTTRKQSQYSTDNMSSGERLAVDALKISDLLGHLEADFAQVRKPQMAPVAEPTPKPQKEHTLEDLQKIAEEEIWMMEQRKLALKRQVEDKRADEERAKILLDLAQPSAELARQNRALRDEALSASSQLQKKLLDLSDKHHTIASQQRAHSLEAQRELDLLNAGKWSVESSNLLAAKLGRSAPAANADVSVSEGLIRKSRVQAILSNMQDQSTVADRRRRIEDLRNREKQVQDIEERAGQPARPTPRGEGSMVTDDGRIDRQLPVSEFLDRWLHEDIRPARPLSGHNINSSHKSPPKKPTAASRAPLVQDVQHKNTKEDPVFRFDGDPPNNPMELEMQRLIEENRRLRASLGQRADDGEQARPSVSEGRQRRRAQEDEPSANPGASPTSIPGLVAHMPNGDAPNIQPQPFPQFLDPAAMGGGFAPFPQMPFAGQVPGNPYGYYPQPFGQPPPFQMQQFGMQPQFPSIGLDPVQQAMLAQMQKIADQLEKENTSILALSSGVGTGQAANPSFYNPLVRNINDPVAPVPTAPSGSVGADDSTRRLSKLELQKQEEIRLLQYELEKLKHLKQLEDFKSQHDTQRVAKQKADSHNNWLEDQKRELQAIKMKQVLLKEQRLLQFQANNLDPDNDEGRNDRGPNARESVQATGASVVDSIREECGVGVNSVPINLAKGVSVVVDGLLIRKNLALLQTSSTSALFRVALGAYDKTGQQSLAKLTASPWQHWETAQSPSGTLQALRDLVMLTIRAADFPSDPIGMKCLVELQVKEGGGEGNRTGSQRSVGWAVCPLLAGSTLKNGLWRMDARSGLSDPKTDVLAPPPSEADSNLFLIRVLDSNENNRASSWRLSEATKSIPAADPLRLYAEPAQAMVSRVASMAKLASSASVINFSQLPGAAGAGMPRLDSARAPPMGGPRASMVNLNAPNVSRRPAPSQTPTSEPGTPVAPLSASMKTLDRLASVPSLLPGNPLDRLEEDEEKDDDMLAPAMVGGNQLGDKHSWWVMGPTLGPCTERYQRGDGVDIYVDRCMFLPDTSTVTRISLRLYASDKEQIGNVYEGISEPDSPAISPIFKLKAEVRGNLLNATATILLRFDTLDASTLVPVSSGYACIKVFASRDRVQPTQSSDPNAFVNTGSFQLPVRGGRIPSNLANFDETMLDTMPHIPCASVLVRILPAPKSSDGISTLSRDEFPPEDWQRMGLDVPAPGYSSGAYNGTSCEPTGSELQAYEAKSELLSLTVETALLQALSARRDHDLPERPTDPQPEAMTRWLRSLLPPLDKMRRMIDYSLAAPYSVETGVAVQVVQLYHLSEGSMFATKTGCTLHKVITSVSPPGLFYKDPPLYDGVRFTRGYHQDSFIRAPKFTDGYAEYLPAEMAFNLYLVLDIRMIKVEPKKKAKPDDPVSIKVEPPGMRRSYWTLLPLSRERCPGQGFRHTQSGYYQLPLIEGAVPAAEIFRAENPFKEVLSRLSMKKQVSSTNAAGDLTSAAPLKLSADQASVLVKVHNPLLRDLILPDLDSQEPDPLYLTPLVEAAAQGQSGSTARIEKFAYQASRFTAENRNAGKTVAQALPGGLPENTDLMKEVNVAFAAATGIKSTA